MRLLNRRTLTRRRRAYQRVFKTTGEDGKDVLRDLAQFCRANESCFDVDPRTHALIEGRREVWLRVQQHLELSDDQLWMLFGGATVEQ